MPVLSSAIGIGKVLEKSKVAVIREVLALWGIRLGTS
jgi:hypothetical protein